MSYCPNCGAEVEAGSSTCPNCGASLVVPVVHAGGFNWGKFFTDLVLKPKEAFGAVLAKKMWWLALASLIAVGLFGGIGILIDQRGSAGGVVARLFFYVLFAPFLFWLFETAALSMMSTLFKGKGASLKDMALTVGVAWLAFVPYTALALIPSKVTDLIFLLIFLLAHIYLLTGVLEENENLSLGPALIVSLAPILFLIILTLLETGEFGLFPL